MSIVSHVFGGVVLTGEDAETFKRQVSHAKPSAKATASVKKGVELARALGADGKLTMKTSADRSP